MNKIHVKWSEVESFVDHIAEKLAGRNLSGVYALPRGGLVIGVMLSHRLNIPLLSASDSRCVIVDDICDSGESLLHYYKNSSAEDKQDRPVICTMYYKENKLGVIPDIYLYEKGNDWIVFPWEV